MFATLFVLLFALASVLTLHYVLADSATFLTSLLSTPLWMFLSLQRDIVAASGGAKLSFPIGSGVRYIFAALALVSAFVLIVHIFGADEAEAAESSDKFHLKT